MTDQILRVESLSRTYRLGTIDVHALRAISFELERGEMLAIMGASGSGKSTLLNILGCLDQPTSGRYVLDGVDVARLSRNERASIRNRKIGFVFQSFNLLPRTTALENVELPLLYNGSSGRDHHARSVAALEKVGLSDRAGHLPNQLSGGQQQRVAIARALVNHPPILLADEPTGNLDSRTSVEIMALFQELNREGATVILITHEPDIAAYAGRTLVLRDGRITSDDRRQPLAAADALARLGPAVVEEEAE